MTKQSLIKLRNLAGFVGDFIRYWGFRRIHGQIWTVIYLSQKPLSGVEIVKLLSVSKALVSPALKELESEGLILQIESENSKTKRYQAEENVEKIIHDVLNRRERPMMREISNSFAVLAAKGDAAFRPQRIENMEKMIQTAQMSLNLLLDSPPLLG